MQRWLGLLLCCASMSLLADTLRHPRAETEHDVRSAYFRALLELALEKTPELGAWQLQQAAEPMPQSRALQLLSEGRELDVVWSMTSVARERQNRPIRIPLLKGLMGYRLLLIRAEDQHWFRNVQTLDQLRELRAGQGHDWPDTQILRANGLSVETSTDYDSLFLMLQRGRFDYLPRALNEPWAEIAARPSLELMVEEKLMLYYPTANYFFVHPDNSALAERLTLGLRRAISDGSFDALFHQHPVNAHAFGNAGIRQRRVIHLTNPLLPEATPVNDATLWWPAPGQ